MLEWFQSHWKALTNSEGDADEQLLGIRVYGMPLCNEEAPVPETLSELKSAIEEYAYCEEVKVSKNCLQVLTDDDEIELVWYVFDENYANRYPEKVSLWLNPILPTSYGNNGLPIKVKNTKMIPKGSEKGYVCYGSSSIYDSSHLSDLEGMVRIEGIRLPQLPDYLRSNSFVPAPPEGEYAAFNELRLLQFLAKQMPTAELKEILGQAAKLPISDLLDSIKIEELDSQGLNDIMKLNMRNDPSKSVVQSSPHLCEWSTNALGEFQNYCVLFDDLWVEKNEALANSITQFFKKWNL